MSLNIINHDDPRGDLVADRELYTNDEHTLLLEADDPRRGVLLAITAGARISGEFVKELDLVSTDGRVEQRRPAPEPDAIDEGAQTPLEGEDVKQRDASKDKQLKTAGKNKAADAKA